MEDDFEIELRIDQLERAYDIAENALKRARLNLAVVRGDPTATSAQIARAEKRCDGVVRRHAALLRIVTQLEEPMPSAV